MSEAPAASERAKEGGRGSKGSVGFVAALVFLVAASLFTGVMLRPLLLGERRSAAQAEEPRTASEIAAFLEHAAVDVRLGRAARLVPALSKLVNGQHAPPTKRRLCELLVEAAVQAGTLPLAARAMAIRIGLEGDPDARARLQLRHITLLAGAGDRDGARALANELSGGATTVAIADEARLRLAAGTQSKAQIKAWVEGTQVDGDWKEARAAGMAALRLLGDSRQAVRLLSAAEKRRKDLPLLRALLDANMALNEHREVVRLAGALAALVSTPREKGTLRLLQARATGMAGDSAGAIELLRKLSTGSDPELQRRAKVALYTTMKSAKTLDAEIARIEKRADHAERAFIALEIERRYELARSLYEKLIKERPDSVALRRGLAIARKREQLAEQVGLFRKLLARDPNDTRTFEKLLAALAALGDHAGLREAIGAALEGQQRQVQRLLQVAVSAGRVGLMEDAVALLERALAIETEPGRKQKILLVLGDLYVTGRRLEHARAVYRDLAAQGVSDDIRKNAVARLAALL